MTKRLSLLPAFAVAAVVTAGAATTFRWLTFTLGNQAQLTVAAENLHITCGDSRLHLSSPTVDETIALDQVKSMRFTDSQTKMELTADDIADGITLYRPNGVKAGDFKSINEARLALPSGIYLMNRKSITTKLVF